MGGVLNGPACLPACAQAGWVGAACAVHVLWFWLHGVLPCCTVLQRPRSHSPRAPPVTHASPAGPSELSHPSYSLRSAGTCALLQYLLVHVLGVLSGRQGLGLVIAIHLAHSAASELT